MIGTTLGLLTVLALIAVGGFFAAAEFALVAVDRNRIKARAEAGSRAAVRTEAALAELSFQLTGAQVGVTASSLLIGFVAEPTIAHLVEPLLEGLPWSAATTRAVSLLVALVLATAAQMVLGELIPKNVALARSEGTALLLGPALRGVNKALAPLIRLFNGSADRLLTLIGIEPQMELEGIRSIEELGLLMRTSAEEGVLDREVADLVRRSLSFADKTALDALVPRTGVAVIRSDADVSDLVELSRRTGHSRFPVIGTGIDDVIGQVHVKDSFRVRPRERATRRVADLMARPVVVPETAPLDSLLTELRTSGTQLAVVVDEHGGMAGIITVEDIIEEIVGEIADEYDPGPARPATLLGTWVVDAMLHHDELHDRCGFDLPDGEWETLAGYLLWMFGRIPAEGDVAEADGWTFAVRRMDGHRIAEVLVRRDPTAVLREAQP
ncbi:MAG: hemolysin family protein [Acidimicrobiia bacterium]